MYYGRNYGKRQTNNYFTCSEIYGCIKKQYIYETYKIGTFLTGITVIFD